MDLSSRKSKGNSNNKKRESVESDTHTEYVHRLSVGSPTSPSQKLFLHSLRERHLSDHEDEDEGEDIFPVFVEGGNIRQRDQHIEHHDNNNNNNTENNTNSQSLLGTSWDSATARKADRKRHFTSRRATVNAREGTSNHNITERVIASTRKSYSSNSQGIGPISEVTPSSKLASSDPSARSAGAGDLLHSSSSEYKQDKKDKKDNNSGKSSSRGSIRHSNKRHSGKSTSRSKDTLTLVGSVASSSTARATGAGAGAAKKGEEQANSNSNSNSTAAPSNLERAAGDRRTLAQGREQRADSDKDEGDYDDEDDDEEEEDDLSSSDEDNSAIEDLMSQIKMSGLDDPTKIVRVPASDGKSGEPREIAYTACKVIGNGSFGVVFQAKLVQGGLPGATDDQIAIKKVLQDKRFKNRELQIMRMVTHPNVVNLNAFFYSNGEKAKKDEVYLNLVLEYVPETVYRASRHYAKMKQTMPMSYIKLYMYQLLRSLAYIHCLGICHRDIKPQNLLLNPHTGVLKLCDFGSAKILVAGEPNVSYICSRYYRAPELIFGATNYTTNIDIWSTGCVMAELMLGQPLFPGESGIDQLVEIIKVLGTPTREQIKTMNPNYMEHKFPQIKPHPFNKVFKARTAPDAISLISKLLEYTPSARLTAIEAMCHPLFDELKQPDAKMQSGKDLPALFDFMHEELSIRPDLIPKLVPPHAEEALKARGIDVHNFEPIPAEQMRISLD